MLKRQDREFRHTLNHLRRHSHPAPTFSISRKYFSFPDGVFDSKVQQLSNFHSDEFPKCERVNGRFVSPWTKDTERSFINARKWLASGDKDSKDKIEIDQDLRLSCQPVDTQQLKQKNVPQFTWIGHSTCYWQTDGVSFLTDPIWSKRCSPISWLGPKRSIEPPIDVEELEIDVILISHSHYDHLDAPTVDRVGNRAKWLVPSGLKSWFASRGIFNCVELKWWEQVSIKSKGGADIDIIFTPAKHWTARTPFDKNKCLWGSFAITAPSSRFFFSGDTAYCDVFKIIGRTFGPFDFSAIAIGAYKPRYAMSHVHCSPEEAVTIARELQSSSSVGIHWGTFPLAGEHLVEPALELRRCRDFLNIPLQQFFTLKPGETFRLGDPVTKDFSYDNSDEYYNYIKQHSNSIV